MLSAQLLTLAVESDPLCSVTLIKRLRSAEGWGQGHVLTRPIQSRVALHCICSSAACGAIQRLAEKASDNRVSCNGSRLHQVNAAVYLKNEA